MSKSGKGKNIGIICIVMLFTDHKLQVQQEQSRDMALAQNRLYTKWKNTALQEMDETIQIWLCFPGVKLSYEKINR